jgi:prolyl-tRNA synthetase
MTTVMPQSELTRKAVAWIAEQQAAGKALPAALEEAGLRFNLGPKEQEFLQGFFAGSNKENQK